MDRFPGSMYNLHCREKRLLEHVQMGQELEALLGRKANLLR